MPRTSPYVIRLSSAGLAQLEKRAGRMNLLGVVIEPDAALMSDPVVLAVNVEAMEVRIAPAHGDLYAVMEIGDRLIAAQQKAAPDHRAHTPQNHLELVDANLTWFGHRSFIVSPAPWPWPDSPVSPGILCSRK